METLRVHGFGTSPRATLVGRAALLTQEGKPRTSVKLNHYQLSL